MSKATRIRDLPGLGSKSEAQIQSVGIADLEAFLATDPFEIYARLKQQQIPTSLNMLYALIGAQEGVHWQVVAREQRSAILWRLDDMGLAP